MSYEYGAEGRNEHHLVDSENLQQALRHSINQRKQMYTQLQNQINVLNSASNTPLDDDTFQEIFGIESSDYNDYDFDKVIKTRQAYALNDFLSQQIRDIPNDIVATSVILTVSQWDDNSISQTVNIPEVHEDSCLIVSPDPSSKVEWFLCNVGCQEQHSGYVIFVADIIPSEDVTANIVIISPHNPAEFYALTLQEVDEILRN